VWPSGKISGLRARGGYEVGEEWKDGKLVSATIKNISGDGSAKIRYGNLTAELHLERGAQQTLGPDLK
jgi:alpha-L-fucosidase 2